MNSDNELGHLGHKSDYIDTYTPDLLFPIPRKIKRDEIGISADQLPFQGWDFWTAFEFSWLNDKGKPCIAMATFQIPCTSKNIIESKSFKLYLNSYNNTRFSSIEQVLKYLEKDISNSCESPIDIQLHSENTAIATEVCQLGGELIDDLDISCDEYMVNPKLLAVESSLIVEETLTSNLLKSNCLVTGQPDWGSLWIHYRGPKIARASLLKYIVSFRNHNEFHEQCVERIYKDIMQVIAPEKLTAYARYTRRGGLDINPFRSNYTRVAPFIGRLFRQ